MDAFAQVAGTPLGGSTGPIDMSVYGLFMQADWVVKAVMIALLLASFWSWAIIFEKMLRLRSLKKSAQVVRGHVLVGRLARGSLRPGRRQAGRSDVEHLLGRHARMAPLGVQGPGARAPRRAPPFASASSR